jgi:hypothetical protein
VVSPTIAVLRREQFVDVLEIGGSGRRDDDEAQRIPVERETHNIDLR